MFSHSTWKCWKRKSFNITTNVQNGVRLHGCKPRNIVSVYSPVSSSTAVCCTSDEITLRYCCSCFFKYFRNHPKWSSSVLFVQFLSLINLLAPKPLNSHIFKNNIQLSLHRLTYLISIIHCRFIETYQLPNCRLFVGLLYQKLLMLTNICGSYLKI